jgi:hypothetical protein
LARTLQQVLDSANALFEADRAGLMLVDHAGALRWASASDQVSAPVSAGQERLAQGPAEVGVDVLQLLHLTEGLRVVHRREDTQIAAHNQLVGQD